MPERDSGHRFLAFHFGYSSTLMLMLIPILGESWSEASEDLADYMLDHLSVISAAFRAFGVDLLGGWEADFVDEFRKRLVAGEGDWIEGRSKALDRTIRSTRWILYLGMDPEERAFYSLGSSLARASMAFVAEAVEHEEAREFLSETAEELVEAARRVNLPVDILQGIEDLAELLLSARAETLEFESLSSQASDVFSKVFHWLSGAQPVCEKAPSGDGHEPSDTVAI